jgi:hypothetical protein
MTNFAISHLKKYPVDTLDPSTLRILIKGADKGLAMAKYLVAIVPSDDPLMSELQAEVTELTEAKALMSQELEKKLQACQEAWNKVIDEERAVRFVTRGGSITEEEYSTPELAREAIAELSQNYTFTCVELVKSDEIQPPHA